MEHLHIIEVKFIPATSTRPDRVKISSDRFKQSVIQSFNAETTTAQAQSYLEARGFEIVGFSEHQKNKCYYLFTRTFQPIR